MSSLTEKQRILIRNQLIRHEGLELKPYADTKGKLTIAVGRNLTDKGLSNAEALYLLDNDIDEAITGLQKEPYWDQLNDLRQRILIDMVHNMGLGGFYKFRRMRGALMRMDYEGAAHEMRDSLWARDKDTAGRAERLARMMESNTDMDDTWA